MDHSKILIKSAFQTNDDRGFLRLIVKCKEKDLIHRYKKILQVNVP